MENWSNLTWAYCSDGCFILQLGMRCQILCHRTHPHLGSSSGTCSNDFKESYIYIHTHTNEYSGDQTDQTMQMYSTFQNKTCHKKRCIVWVAKYYKLLSTTCITRLIWGKFTIPKSPLVRGAVPQERWAQDFVAQRMHLAQEAHECTVAEAASVCGGFSRDSEFRIERVFQKNRSRYYW